MYVFVFILYRLCEDYVAWKSFLNSSGRQIILNDPYFYFSIDLDYITIINKRKGFPKRKGNRSIVN